MTDTNQIRRRTDGSIDTGFYMARGRRHRSAAAHGLLPDGRARRTNRPPLAALAAGVFGIGFL